MGFRFPPPDAYPLCIWGSPPIKSREDLIADDGAYALAGARCGALLAHADIVSLLARVITPYSLPTQTIEAVLKFTDAQHCAESGQQLGAGSMQARFQGHRPEWAIP